MLLTNLHMYLRILSPKSNKANFKVRLLQYSLFRKCFQINCACPRMPFNDDFDKSRQKNPMNKHFPMR